MNKKSAKSEHKSEKSEHKPAKSDRLNNNLQILNLNSAKCELCLQLLNTILQRLNESLNLSLQPESSFIAYIEPMYGRFFQSIVLKTLLQNERFSTNVWKSLLKLIFKKSIQGIITTKKNFF